MNSETVGDQPQRPVSTGLKSMVLPQCGSCVGSNGHSARSATGSAHAQITLRL